MLVPRRFRKITRLDVVVTALMALAMLVFYVLAFFEPSYLPYTQTLNAVYAVGAFALLVAVYHFGENLPRWMMYGGALAEVAAFVYFVAFTPNHQQLIFRLQEFPLIALYLSWVFPAWVARLTIYPALLFTIPYSVYLGPSAGTEHNQGILNILGLMLFTLLGLGVGFYAREYFKLETEYDGLTGARNRRGLSRHGEQAILRGRKKGEPMCFAMVDLDGFKVVNDTQGHNAGDKVLKDLVEHWSRSMRKTDMVFRLGGDEFVLLMPRTTIEEAEKLIRRVRENSPTAWSFGLAAPTPEDNVGTVLLRADRNMYEAKRMF